jgi:Family of unknown function (DUF6941)
MGRVEVDAFLADSVQAVGGKLYALGIGWRALHTQGFPARHDRVGIGLIVRTGPDEAGAHQLRLALVGPDHQELPLVQTPDGTTGTALEATFAAPDGEGTTTLALNLDGLVFSREGPHAFAIAIDGRELTRLAFSVHGQGEPSQPEFGTGVYL